MSVVEASSLAFLRTEQTQSTPSFLAEMVGTNILGKVDNAKGKNNA